MKALRNHVSPETAYVVNDYPYGFRLRCKIRYWVERTTRGERICTQTTNPKKAGEVWNKPKKSTYNDVAFLFINELGYVSSSGFSIAYSDLAKWEKYIAEHDLDFVNDEYYVKLLHKMKVVDEARKHITVTISPGTKSVFEKEQEELNLRKVIAYAEAKVDGRI